MTGEMLVATLVNAMILLFLVMYKDHVRSETVNGLLETAAYLSFIIFIGVLILSMRT